MGVEGGDGGVVVEIGVEEAAEVGGHAADVGWGSGEAFGETSDVVWGGWVGCGDAAGGVGDELFDLPVDEGADGVADGEFAGDGGEL